jgi:hypothetical protein
MEFDVTEDGEGHEEDEGCVEEDKSGLRDVPVVWLVSMSRSSRDLPKRTRKAEKRAMPTG